MTPQRRRASTGNLPKIVLPTLEDVEADDLGYLTAPVERRCILEKKEGLHIRPASTVQILSNRLREDYSIIGWFSRDDGRKASTVSVQDMEALGVQDGEEVTVDLRCPKVFGSDKMARLLDVYERLLKDSDSLEGIEAMPYVKEAYRVLGLPGDYVKRD
ncbi:MAG: hypothetical protein GF416_01100 [Candidatus Altiarchaeales archaeon]|nr:hypothetical protein [Candidatus Altiarchaeales archaeon]MBD3415713.1 hypothetical protein [Candidatus Altiarchaeales archaeon]